MIKFNNWIIFGSSRFYIKNGFFLGSIIILTIRVFMDLNVVVIYNLSVGIFFYSFRFFNYFVN